MKRVCVCVFAAGLSTSLGSCTSSDAATVPQVVAAAYPFAFVAEQVGGDLVEVHNLTSPGMEPHDIELTPQQLADLIDADLVIVERGFQAAVDDGLQQVDSGRIDSRNGTLLDVAETVSLEESTTDADVLDPHVWLDPDRMVAITRAIADRVAALVPSRASQVRANARRLVGKLRDLDDEYESGMAECTRRTFVTGHAAFGYLASRYDLEMVSVVGLDPTLEPSPAEQAAIAAAVEREGVTTIFTETLVSPAVAETIADEAGAQVRTLDPIEGLSDASSDETYLTLMRSNLAALQLANGCS